MRRRFQLPKVKKCKATGKTMFKKQFQADRAKWRIWSHDPSAKMEDLHSYLCPDCKQYHVGHISYYRKSLQQQGATA